MKSSRICHYESSRIWHPRTFITQKHVTKRKFKFLVQTRICKLKNFRHVWSKGRPCGRRRGWRSLFCFGDDSHQRDARHSHHREDQRDAETAHYVCTVLFYLNSNKNYHSICQQIDKSDISTLVLKTRGPTQVRTKREVRHRISPCVDLPSKFVLLSPTHIKDEAGEKSDIASLRAWILHTGPWPPSRFVLLQRISHAWIMSNWTSPSPSTPILS